MNIDGRSFEAYDRPPVPRRSPSPGPSRGRRFSDRYVPPDSPWARDDYAPTFQPGDRWSERGGDYYRRTPSPPRYLPPRPMESDPWGRTIPWEPSSSWSGVRPPSPPGWYGRHEPMKEPSPAFEPSDAWKQSHASAPLHSDIPPRPRQNSYRPREYSPERVTQWNDKGYPSFYGDSYRPGQTHRDTFMEREPPPVSPFSNSYRPRYDVERTSAFPRMSAMGNYKRPERQMGRNIRPSGDSYRPARWSRDRSLSPGSSRGGRSSSPPQTKFQKYDRDADRERRSSPRLPRRSGSLSSVDSEYPRKRRRKRSTSSTRSSRSGRSRSSDSIRSSRSNSRHPDARKASVSISGKGKAPADGHSEQSSKARGKSLEPIPSLVGLGITVNGKPIVPGGGGSAAKDSPHSPPATLEPVSGSVLISTDGEVSGGRASDSASSLAAAEPLAPFTGDGSNESSRSEPFVALTPSQDQKPLGTALLISSPAVTVGLESQQLSVHDVLESGLSPALDSQPMSLDTRQVGSDDVSGQARDSLGSFSGTGEPVGDKDGLPGRTMDVDDVDAVGQTISSDKPVQSESDITCLADALRMVVMTRLRYDRQVKEERVEPILLSNLSLAEPPSERTATSAEDCVHDVLEGARMASTLASHAKLRDTLGSYIHDLEAKKESKIQNLRQEYLRLQDDWLAHCARLDAAAAAVVHDEATATTGRSTRRSAVSLSDAVRSDLEMEQIIASLGVNDMTDPSHLSLRNSAVVPDMISVSHGRVEYLFDDCTALVEDPHTFYETTTGIEDWTEWEKKTFLEKFAAYPKQFGIIADFLPHKTPSQCVAYYYLHKKKFINFRRVVTDYTRGKRRVGGSGRSKGHTLMTDIRRHDAEVSGLHNGPTTRRRRAAHAVHMVVADVKKASSRRGGVQPDATPEPDGRSKRRRTNPTARALAAREQEEEDRSEVEVKAAKKGKRGRKPKVVEEPTPSPAPETKFIDVSEVQPRRRPPTVNVYWSEEDRQLFLKLLSQHGDDFKRIAASMPNKTTIQVSNYYKTNSTELDLEKVVASAPKRSPTPEVPEDPFIEGINPPGSGVLSPVTDTRPGTPVETPSRGTPPMSSLDQGGRIVEVPEASSQIEPNVDSEHNPQGPMMSWFRLDSATFHSHNGTGGTAQSKPAHHNNISHVGPRSRPQSQPPIQPQPYMPTLQRPSSPPRPPRPAPVTPAYHDMYHHQLQVQPPPPTTYPSGQYMQYSTYNHQHQHRPVRVMVPDGADPSSHPAWTQRTEYFQAPMQSGLPVHPHQSVALAAPHHQTHWPPPADGLPFMPEFSPPSQPPHLAYMDHSHRSDYPR